MINTLATLDIADGIGTLTLRRSDSRNALSIAMLEAMHERLREAGRERTLRALVIRGDGKAFCAGMDLKAVMSDPVAARSLLHLLADFTTALRALPMVTIACVHGAAIGGGCGLACACDVAMTHAESKMGFPEVDLGVCPAVVAPILVRKIGAGRARKVLLMGGLMSGSEAHEAGIVDYLAASVDELHALCDKVTGALRAAGPHALRTTKDLLNRLDGSVDPAMVREGADLSARVLATPETQAMLKEKFGK
jgi:enoyl-CoA hydratase/carnithine racemase